MPAGASRKRERQYEHIKDSYEDRGVSKAEAEERAREPSTKSAARLARPRRSREG